MECSIRVGCYFWTWNSEKSSRFPNTCWLKSRTGDQNKKTAENKISGPRSCQDTFVPDLALGNDYKFCLDSNQDIIDVFTGQTLELFNLDDDPEERTNLAVNQSDTAPRMLAKLMEIASSSDVQNTDDVGHINLVLLMTNKQHFPLTVLQYAGPIHMLAIMLPPSIDNIEMVAN